jgi:UDP-4-amino-4-deoxy-L-arabinose formyltransferase/UDP-glucuronic acid dehydrogenase (UDP-4-keto-hexauronic acid decarboxylating)
MNIYVLSTNEARLDAIAQINKEFPIKGLIGLSKREVTDKISGYFYMKPFCQKNNLEFVAVDDYSLKNEKDKTRLLKLKVDLLLVLGWQRLIPDWLINHCQIGVIGIHGSAEGIAGGRGRSPQNWALIMDKKEFHISTFFINTGIDEGAIIDTKTFLLSEFDTIKTSYYKDNLLTAQMIISNLRNGRILKKQAKAQSGKTSYLPQRIPEDGAIDWKKPTKNIYNFIRALTKPYPGAFSKTNRFKIVIWQAQPFAMDKKQDYKTIKPGTIIKIFPNNWLLVKTLDDNLLITDYKTEPKNIVLKEGQVLPSVNFEKQMAEIIARHRKKYPNLPLSKEITKLAQ